MASAPQALLRPVLPNFTTLALRGVVVHIGRGVVGEHDILVAPDDEAVSRDHALIHARDGAWFLDDFSRNGTRVNNQLVHNSSVQLRTGDVVAIGRSFWYVFWSVADTGTLDASSAGAAAKPAPPKRGIVLTEGGDVLRDGERINEALSPAEYQLLHFMWERPGQICSYNAVSKAVWGDVRGTNHVHELIYRLRRKIEPAPSKPKYLIIRTKLGVVFFPEGEP